MPISLHDTALKSRPDQLSSSPTLPTRSCSSSPALSRSTPVAQPAAPNTPIIAESPNEIVDRNISEPPLSGSADMHAHTPVNAERDGSATKPVHTRNVA